MLKIRSKTHQHKKRWKFGGKMLKSYLEKMEKFFFGNQEEKES